MRKREGHREGKEDERRRKTYRQLDVEIEVERRM